MGGEASTSGRSMSAREKLAMLDRVRDKRLEVLTGKDSTPYNSGAPGVVDVRLYHSAVESQKRMSAKLAEASAHVSYMERRLEEADADLCAAAGFLSRLAAEFGSVGRLAGSARAAVRFGVERADAAERLGRLEDRLEDLTAAVEAQRAAFARRVPVPVPIAWVGVANAVVLMGDFDGWTRGFELSAASEAQLGAAADGVVRCFESEVPLRPGRYTVKFRVDGEWRLAADWPTERDELGETNNILVVK